MLPLIDADFLALKMELAESGLLEKREKMETQIVASMQEAVQPVQALAEVSAEMDAQVREVNRAVQEMDQKFIMRICFCCRCAIHFCNLGRKLVV